MNRKQQRIESNRNEARTAWRGIVRAYVIQNALVETYGLEGCLAAYERCLQSLRFPLLLAMALRAEPGNASWVELVAAAAKIAANPNTKACKFV